MRTPMGRLTIVLLLLACHIAWAQQAEPAVTLQYTPSVGDSQDSAVVGKLADLQINEMSLGITGHVSGIAKLAVTKVDEETGEFTLRITFDELKAEFASQPREPKPIPPTEITFSKHGDLLKILRPDTPGDVPGLSGLEALTAGGLPLDLVVLMATSLRLPDEPLAVGEAWMIIEEQELPIVGKTKVTTVTTLVKVEGNKATLETHASADVPAFEMDNPLMEGKIKVESGKFTAEKTQREFDMDRSLIVRAKGSFKVELVADMGFGAPVPIAAIAEFDLRPAEGPAPAPAEEPAPAEQPAPQPEPKQDAEDQANKPGVSLGPLAAKAGYAAGTVTVTFGVDMSKVPLPAALGQYRPLLSLTRVSCSVDAGVAGPNAGKVALGGQLQVGPFIARKTFSVDAKAVAERIVAVGLSLLRRQ